MNLPLGRKNLCASGRLQEISDETSLPTMLEGLAGEPGFAAKLNMSLKSLKTLMSPVANLATWTMSVANGQGRLVVRSVVMRGQVLASSTALEQPKAAD
ncbi:MAG: hypothetical protein RIB57_17695 [Pelagibacterium sp.]|uniref:hypothetical protein n=1 Tax=Pelagibacterium sp. TaxID=1967288 RepID=UPI0032EB3985